MKGQGCNLLMFALVVLAVTIYSCSHEPIPTPANHNSVICDTLNVKYSTCVQPIFKNNCYQCHSDSASQHGVIAFDIENFTSLKFYLNNYYHNDSIYGSKFMSVIGYRLGVVHMPPDYQMPATEIGVVQKWVDNGALDN